MVMYDSALRIWSQAAGIGLGRQPGVEFCPFRARLGCENVRRPNDAHCTCAFILETYLVQCLRKDFTK